MKIYAKVDGAHYEFERPEIDSRGFTIGSWAKFCRLCLGGWAHMTAVLPGPRMKGDHCVRGQLCARCGAQTPPSIQPCVPGSLLEEPQSNFQSIDWDLLSYLPRALLLREFYLHDQFLTRQDPSYGNTAEPKHQPSTAIQSSTSHERQE